MAPPQEKAPEPSPTDKAAERTREAAKWLVAGFGAVAAVLVGNASIQDLSGLSSEGRQQAVIGIVLALAGVLIVLVPMGVVLASGRVSLPQIAGATRFWPQQFRAAVDAEHYTLLRGHKSVQELVAQHALYQYERTKSYAIKHQLEPPAKPERIPESVVTSFESPTGTVLDAPDRLEKAERGLQSTNAAVDAVVEFAASERLRHRFRQALSVAVVGVLLAGVGALLFATAETTQAAETRAKEAALALDIGAIPVPAQLVVGNETRQQLQPLLGNECDLDSVFVIVISSDEMKREVLTLPEEKCRPRRLQIGPADGELIPVAPVCRFNESTGVSC